MAVKDVIKKRAMLKEALVDLDRELTKLRLNKNNLASELKKFSSQVSKVKEQESQLKNQISILLMKETQLMRRKKDTQSDLKTLNERLIKVSKIKDELSEV